MRRSVCPECNGTEFYSREVDASGGYGPVLLPGFFFKSPKFLLRICGRCGFVKFFVPERFLEGVREKGKFRKE